MAERLEPPGTVAGTPRQEALEGEPVGRKAGQDQRGDRRRRAGHDAHFDPSIDRAPDDPVAGIRHTGHAAVGDDRDVFTGVEPFDDFGRARVLVALEHRDERRADVEAVQEAAGPARVLRGDQRHRGERLARAVGQIAEVPDRRADEVEDAAHHAMVPRPPPPTMGRMAEPHKDYSATPLPTKLGIREGAKVFVAGAPEGFDACSVPCRPASSASGAPAPRWTSSSCSRPRSAPLRARFARLAAGLEPAGRLWVAWPKKAAKVPTDLDFDTVQGIGLTAGLVDNKSASITDTFQGLQFVYRLKDRPR